ncbi:hypothetical protein CEP54_014072 [Fusarium duplospermum]|uniref:Uncharacterized protein n=1 Tax=Fusarium duplospermum TaxID=1325734 RepID=A0A428NYQ3_9HYPO|nr:hypothetical protein CEP54_014072 [Fusarium duplospermum]
MTNHDYFGFQGMIQRRQLAQPFPLTRPIAPFPESHPHPDVLRPGVQFADNGWLLTSRTPRTRVRIQ